MHKPETIRQYVEVIRRLKKPILLEFGLNAWSIFFSKRNCLFAIFLRLYTEFQSPPMLGTGQQVWGGLG